ncbi:MAG TPA: hypothetical protein PLE78_13005 [Flavobacteriales bacterium]|nr:hypothetical protein [Flavobacteriales bacterium]
MVLTRGSIGLAFVPIYQPKRNSMAFQVNDTEADAMVNEDVF